MAERVLSPRALNRALLARQLLLERGKGALPKLVDRVCGIQSQYAPSAYVGLWSRVQGFDRDALTKALETKRLVQATSIRATIHVLSPGDYRAFGDAVRRERRASWFRAQQRQIPGVDMDDAAARVRKLLARGPTRVAELQKRLASDGFPPFAVVSSGMWIDLVRVPPSGTWERPRADLYGLADDWLGAHRPGDEATAIAHLVKRYLGGFGPSSLDCIASFTGLSIKALSSAIAGLKLRRFRDEQGAELLDVPGAPLPDPETPAPVRFLPTWDATLLVHARRTQLLPERYRKRIFSTKTPHSVCTFLVDGSVAGCWRYERGEIHLEPFEKLARKDERALEEEAERLAAFHASSTGRDRA